MLSHRPSICALAIVGLMPIYFAANGAEPAKPAAPARPPLTLTTTAFADGT